MDSKEVTVSECIEMFERDRQRTVINDGMVVGFQPEWDDDGDE